MYTVSQFGNMYMNSARINAFSAALRDVVTRNSVVVDIGAGTGIFALLACRYGARRVYAIEPDNSIGLARELAAANGYSDRVTFIQSLSTSVALPERADVVIWDLSGLLPLYAQHVPAIIDAKQRFLADHGVLIPQQDHLRAAIIEASGQYDKLREPWGSSVLGLDLSAGWPLVANTWNRLTDKQAKLLTRPSTLAVLDYRTIANSDVDGELAWTMDQPCTAQGVAVWFDRVVSDGLMISNQPGAPEAVNVSGTYGQGFFPWPNAVNVVPGDEVSFYLKANLRGDEYHWWWETTICAGREVKAHFRQSSLYGHSLSIDFLKRREADYVATPNDDAQIDAFILSKIDGHTSLREIACGLAAMVPLRFGTWQEALSRVGDVTSRYAVNA